MHTYYDEKGLEPDFRRSPSWRYRDDIVDGVFPHQDQARGSTAVGLPGLPFLSLILIFCLGQLVLSRPLSD